MTPLQAVHAAAHSMGARVLREGKIERDIFDIWCIRDWTIDFRGGPNRVTDLFNLAIVIAEATEFRPMGIA